MEFNHEKGIQNMRVIANNWKFKALTIFGKITVNKTFMLPQLTHVAAVVPSLTIKQRYEINIIWNDFIREGSPNVVNRKNVYTPVKEDGLGLHKAADFWGAVKLSWLRRLPYTKSLWKSIHNEETGHKMFDPTSYNLDLLITAKKELKIGFVWKFTRI